MPAGESREILLNAEIVAVNQDPLGGRGWRANKNGAGR